MIKNLLSVIFLFCYIDSSFAVQAYISDDIPVYYRTGPSTKYRVSGTVSFGETITIIDIKTSKRFLKIKTLTGRTGWIARNKIKFGESTLIKMEKLEQSVTHSIILIKKQANEIHRLKSLLNKQKVKNDKQTYTQNLLTSKISNLNQQIDNLDDSNLIRWLTHVAILGLLGAFLILIISRLTKRKSYNEIH